MGATSTIEPPEPMSPAFWAQSLSGAPVLDRAIGGIVPTSVRRWTDVDPDIEQHALDQLYVSVHLGGAKRLWRRGESAAATRDVTVGAYSVVPAGAAFRWETTGPIDFVHFYFSPDAVDRVVASAFDRDPARVTIEDPLGETDPMIAALALGLIEELAHGDCQQAYLDDMTHLLLCRVLRNHSNARQPTPRARHVLAPYRLQRAIEFIEAHLAEPIGVGEIAHASGISRYHFSRVFQQTTGRAPYAYLLERRVDVAKTLLIGSDDALGELGARCGFASASQFSRMFKRLTGITPAAFRHAQR